MVRSCNLLEKGCVAQDAAFLGPVKLFTLKGKMYVTRLGKQGWRMDEAAAI